MLGLRVTTVQYLAKRSVGANSFHLRKSTTKTYGEFFQKARFIAVKGEG